jgi:signal peptidase I
MSTTISSHGLRWPLLVLGLVLLVRQWAWTPTLVTGESMRPTLCQGQLLGINKLAYRFRAPQRGDVIVVRIRRGRMIKRILGLPGETIAIRGGIVFVNRSPLAEPYVRFHDPCDIAPGRLGPDRFVIAGDNRCQTLIAVVHRSRIEGRVMRLRPTS